MSTIIKKVKYLMEKHRKKMLIIGGVVGGTVLIIKVAQFGLTKFQEHQANIMIERFKKEHHFESVEKRCDKTILGMGKRLYNEVLNMFKFEEIIAKLKAESPGDVDDWNKLKIISFSSICLIIYSETLLVTVLRVQLGLIGGYKYQDLDKTGNIQLDSQLQEDYLSICPKFINKGVDELYELIKSKVEHIVCDIHLTKKLSVESIQSIFWSIHASMDDEILLNITSYLCIDEVTTDDMKLREIYEETWDILNSDTVLKTLKSAVSFGFTYFLELVVDGCVENTSLPLAKLLPKIHTIIRRDSNENNVHQFLTFLMEMNQLKVLCANIYESYSGLVL